MTLGGHGDTFSPSAFASVCSSIKWTLIGITTLYAIGGLALLVRERLSDPASTPPADQPSS